jgi:hypothetical protein
MNDESLTELEQQLTMSVPAEAPCELRRAVLADVRRELAAARWDRRLARTAVAAILLGVGLNTLVAFDLGPTDRASLTVGPSQESLVRTAVAVAEATDRATGSRVARQIAILGGRPLTAEQSAALDSAVERRLRRTDL